MPKLKKNQTLAELLADVPTLQDEEGNDIEVELTDNSDPAAKKTTKIKSLPITDHKGLMIDTPAGRIVTVNIWCPGTPIAASKIGQATGSKFRETRQNDKDARMIQMAQYLFDMAKKGVVGFMLQEVPVLQSDRAALEGELIKLCRKHNNDKANSDNQINLKFLPVVKKDATSSFGECALVNVNKLKITEIPKGDLSPEDAAMGGQAAHYKIKAVSPGDPAIEFNIHNVHADFNTQDNTLDYIKHCVAKGDMICGDFNLTKAGAIKDYAPDTTKVTSISTATVNDNLDTADGFYDPYTPKYNLTAAKPISATSNASSAAAVATGAPAIKPITDAAVTPATKLQNLVQNVPTLKDTDGKDVTAKLVDKSDVSNVRQLALLQLPITPFQPTLEEKSSGFVVSLDIWTPGHPLRNKSHQTDNFCETDPRQAAERMRQMAKYLFDMAVAGATEFKLTGVVPDSNHQRILQNELHRLAENYNKANTVNSINPFFVFDRDEKILTLMNTNEKFKPEIDIPAAPPPPPISSADPIASPVRTPALDLGGPSKIAAASAPFTAGPERMLDKKADIKTALNDKYPKLNIEDKNTQLIVKKGGEVIFIINPAEISTNDDSLETFKAMLTSFKAANPPGKMPAVSTFNDDAKKTWEKAIKDVYPKEMADGLIKVTVVPPIVKPAPAVAVTTLSEPDPDTKKKNK